MSVEKFNPRIYGESVPYTQVNTKVIQEITNLEAGFVWVYLLTLPPNWKVVKEHLKNHFGIGKEKIKKIFSYLKVHNLIEYTQSREENGQMGEFDICVLNGSRFISDSVQTAGSENRPPVQPATGETPTTYKIDLQSKQKNKINISCSSDDEPMHEFTLFDYFWSIYPRKQKKIDAKKIWDRKKYEKIASKIFDNIKERLSSEWKNLPKNFIPLPSSFLNGERWNDEVIEQSNMGIKETGSERAMRLCLN